MSRFSTLERRQKKKQRNSMVQEEFLNTDWKHHDIVKLTNGKEYVVQKHKKRYILLLSVEYSAYFVADHNIVVGRTYESRYGTYEEALETDTLTPHHRVLIEEYQVHKPTCSHISK